MRAKARVLGFSGIWLGVGKWPASCFAAPVVMPVSALVVTLDPGDRTRRGVMYVLSRDPRVSVGVPVGDRLPVVTDTSTLEESEDVADQLLQVPGIRFVDVVSVDFSDVATSQRR